MIHEKDKTINKLLSAVYTDRQDKTTFRINIDKVLHVLATSGYLLPTQTFEAKLNELLNKKIVGKLKVTQATRFNIVVSILELADRLHINESEIARYVTSHNTEEDIREMQQKLDNWRQEYYGSLPKGEKEALLEALHNKLRPEVLEKIRKA